MRYGRSLLAVLIFLGLAVGCSDPEQEAQHEAQERSCMSNLKQLGLGMFMYARDHNGCLPPANRWTDAVMSYAGNEALLHCPAAPELECSYAFNANLSEVNVEQIPDRAELVMLFDSNLGTRNASGGPEDIADPPRFGCSAPRRHPGGNNYLYADGRVRASATSPAFTW